MQSHHVSPDEYPQEHVVYSAPGLGCVRHRELLNDHAQRVFEPQRIDLEILYTGGAVNGSGSGFVTQRVDSLDELERLLPSRPAKAGEQRFYLIHQTFSWGRLQITLDAFRRVLTHERVFAPFLDVVYRFGSRTRDALPRDDNFYGYVRDSRAESVVGLSSSCREEKVYHQSEVVYLLQYVEENGRGHGDPWSLRQLGVYMQTDGSEDDKTKTKKKCTWLLLRLNGATRQQFEAALQQQQGRPASGWIDSFRDMIELNGVLMLATLDNWRRYTQDLHSLVRELEEKATFSRVGSTSSASHGYQIGFSDIQASHRLRARLLETVAILQSCLDVAVRLQAHWDAIEVHKNNAAASTTSAPTRETIGTAIDGPLERYKTEIQSSQSNVRILLQVLQGTSDLLSQITTFHTANKLSEINSNTSRTVALLQGSVSQIHIETRGARTLSIDKFRDSMTIKALAMASLIFLPVSLIATIFSSNLIQLRQDGDSSDGTGDGKDKDHFVLATQFWVFVVSSVVLTLVTVAGTRGLEYLWLRTHVKKVTSLGVGVARP